MLKCKDCLSTNIIEEVVDRCCDCKGCNIDWYENGEFSSDHINTAEEDENERRVKKENEIYLESKMQDILDKNEEFITALESLLKKLNKAYYDNNIFPKHGFKLSSKIREVKEDIKVIKERDRKEVNRLNPQLTLNLLNQYLSDIEI